jgi:limonene-1,2-epoxide hydrolase
MAAPERENLSLVVVWLDALRRGDPEAVKELLAPDVVWQGVPDDAECRSRDEVIDMLRTRLADGLPHAHALELVATEDTVVLGVRAPDLREIGDERLPGQLFNVFFLRDGRIAAIQDHAIRGEALRAAGASEPHWV